MLKIFVSLLIGSAALAAQNPVEITSSANHENKLFFRIDEVKVLKESPDIATIRISGYFNSDSCSKKPDHFYLKPVYEGKDGNGLIVTDLQIQSAFNEILAMPQVCVGLEAITPFKLTFKHSKNSFGDEKGKYTFKDVCGFIINEIRYVDNNMGTKLVHSPVKDPCPNAYLPPEMFPPVKL